MSGAMRSIGRMEWQATLLLAVVFGAGIAVGAAIDHSRGAAPPPFEGARPPGPLPMWLVQMDLSEDQHARIRAILDAQRPKVDAVMNGILPRLQVLSDSTFTEIRGVLTPEQQARFDRDRPRRELAPGMPGSGRGDGRGPPGDGRGPPPPDDRGPPRPPV
jgi:Spy/CpxP family protein refolding chaperone